MVALESPVLIFDMISMVELGPKEEHKVNVDGIVDDCMTCHMRTSQQFSLLHACIFLSLVSVCPRIEGESLQHYFPL